MSKLNRKHVNTQPKETSFDTAVMLLGFVEPLFVLPQLYQIYNTQDASGLSLLTWSLYVLSSVVFMVWGFKRKLKPIYLPQSAWIIFEIMIVIGIIKYS